MGLWVPAGSRNENKNISGITHLIEHLIFKGTNKRSGRDIAIEFDLVGAEFNAFTDKENCCIYADFIDTYIDKCTELLFDIILNPSFLKEHIITEKKVVIEEIKMIEDNPSENVINYFYREVFKGHPLNLPVLGTKESVINIKRPSILEYFGSEFDISRLIVSAAGNVRHIDLVEKVKKYTNKNRGRKKTGTFKKVELPQNKKIKRIPSSKTDSVHICFGGAGCGRNDKDKYPISLFTNLLGGSMSSRLFQKIREEEGMAYSIFSNNIQYFDTGIIIIYASVSPGNTERVMKLIKSEIRNIARYGIEDSEFNRARENLKGGIVLSVEDISSRMFRLGKALLFDKKVLTINEILKKIDSVKKQDLVDISGKYLNLDKMSLIMMGKVN
jgi:predicted Zn-dependent peptidase